MSAVGRSQSTPRTATRTTTDRPGSASTAHRARSRTHERGGGCRRGGRGTRGGGIIAVAVLALVALAIVVGPSLDHTVRKLALPLSNERVIREQAAAKHLDPALIAAVIYAETKFDPRTSPAGAEGLMQIEPATAEFLAKLSGGYKFTVSDLGTPAVNVAYGSYYLRYLLDHYSGDEMLSVAAYNAGLANVDRWVAQARAEGKILKVEEIPFGQTRAYVQRVLQAQREYRELYGHQLGIG
jgi:soluble lytic murein transglycosylase